MPPAEKGGSLSDGLGGYQAVGEGHDDLTRAPAGWKWRQSLLPY